MSELQEVDIEEELAKSDNEDVPSLSIKTEPLEESGSLQEQDELNKDESKMSQKELLASLIEGSPDESKNSLEEGEVDETLLNKDSLEEGEVDESNPPISLEVGEIPDDEIAKATQESKTSLEEGEVDETKLNKTSLEEGEVDETKLNKNPVEDTDESSDDEDNFSFRNLEQDIDSNILKFYHPETENINYKELLTLSSITRNKKGEIIDPFHKTVPFLTQYEKAKILGQRAKQINHGSIPFVEVPSNIIDGHTIALMELNQQKIPFIIRRPIPNGTSEYWKVKDLKVIS